MTRIWVGLAIAMTACSIAAAADVGTLTPVVCEENLFGGQTTGGAIFSKPTADCGTVNPNAMVAKLKLGGHAIAIAIDSQKADAPAADVLRIDLSGQGNFDDKSIIPLKVVGQMNNGPYYQFGPKSLTITIDKKQVPVTFWGYYYSYRGSVTILRQLEVAAGIISAGSCQFGDKVHAVRLIDANANLKLGEAGSVDLERNPTSVGGDAVEVDLNDGSFTKDTVRVPLGQPIKVDGKWFELAISDAADKITAKEVEVLVGKISIPGKGSQALLVGRKNIVRVSSGDSISSSRPGNAADGQAVEVPADDYIIATDRYADRQTVFVSAMHDKLNKDKTWTVKPGETLKLPLDTPLTAKVIPTVATGNVQFDMDFRDGCGLKVVSIITGKELSNPKLEILDSQGNGVYKATMEFG